MKAYLSLPHEIPSFQYWLLRVCKNLWLDHLRKHKRLVSAETYIPLTGQQTPEVLYRTGERHRALWRAIGSLSPPDRELVTLHYFSGLPLNEVAEISGKSYAATRQRMVRLRAVLKQKLEDEHGSF